MTTNTSTNLAMLRLSVGFTITGGISARSFTVNGTGNTTLTAQQSIVLTLPNRATDTVVGYGDYTAKGVLLVGTGSGTFTQLTSSTNGFVLTLDSSQTSGMKWASSPAAAAGVTSWVNVTASTQVMTTQVGYFANNATSVAFTLPTTAAQFDFMEIVGIQGAWTLAQNSGQSVVFGNVTSTVGVGGSVASVVASDCIVLQCIVANTTWKITRGQGNATIV